MNEIYIQKIKVENTDSDKISDYRHGNNFYVSVIRCDGIV